MGINTDPNNCDIPIVKASAVLLLSKYWEPFLMEGKDLENPSLLIVHPCH